MKKLVIASGALFRELVGDFMMVVCIIAPILMGIAFRFLIPVLENVLCLYFHLPQIIRPYYAVFDLLLAVMTPVMFCFAGVLVILEEIDYGVAKYFFITPLGKKGYLVSRIGIPSFISFFYTILLLTIFSITSTGFTEKIIYAAGGCIMALMISIFVVAYAKNKMEGMALVKLSGLLVLGIPVVFFIKSSVQYFFALLPSYWLAKISTTGEVMYFIPMFLISVVFIYALSRRFQKRLL